MSKIKVTGGFLLVLLLWSGNIEAGRDEGFWDVSSVEEITEDSGITRKEVRFTNEQTYVIPLRHARLITVLRAADDTYFLLAVGKGCQNCDENASLYIFKLGGPKLVHTGRRYSFPGEYSDYIQPYDLLRKSRTFYGNCLQEQGDVVVWFSRYLGEDNDWHINNSVVRLSMEGDKLTKLGADASVSAVLARTQSGSCSEIPGTVSSVEP